MLNLPFFFRGCSCNFASSIGVENDDVIVIVLSSLLSAIRDKRHRSSGPTSAVSIFVCAAEVASPLNVKRIGVYAY